MQKRDLWSAAAGAAVAAVAIIGTRELTSSAARTRDLAGDGSGDSTSARETAKSGTSGRAGGRAELDASLTPRPLEEANENLVEQVRD